jgi:hypothetical protein
MRKLQFAATSIGALVNGCALVKERKNVASMVGTHRNFFMMTIAAIIAFGSLWHLHTTTLPRS